MCRNRCRDRCHAETGVSPVYCIRPRTKEPTPFFLRIRARFRCVHAGDRGHSLPSPGPEVIVTYNLADFPAGSPGARGAPELHFLVRTRCLGRLSFPFPSRTCRRQRRTSLAPPVGAPRRGGAVRRSSSQRIGSSPAAASARRQWHRSYVIRAVEIFRFSAGVPFQSVAVGHSKPQTLQRKASACSRGPA